MRTLKCEKKNFFAHENMKKPPQKLAHLSRKSVVSEIFHLLPTNCPTAQMAEVMFQNVVYRATVYRTGMFLFIYLPSVVDYLGQK